MIILILKGPDLTLINDLLAGEEYQYRHSGKVKKRLALSLSQKMEADVISCCLSIMRRMPPSKVNQNLSGLLRLVPESTDELLQRVDQPLEEAKDPETVRMGSIGDDSHVSLGPIYRLPLAFCLHVVLPLTSCWWPFLHVGGYGMP